MSCRLSALLVVCLVLLTSAIGFAADLTYTLQPVAQIGGMAGDVPLPTGLSFILAGLNDQGEILFDAGSGDGSRPDRLIRYANNQFAPLFAAGLDGPVGPWPNDIFLFGPG